MGQITAVPLVRPMAGLLAVDLGRLATGREALEDFFGPVAGVSEPTAFIHSDYYQTEMGTGLLRQFLVFARLRPPEELPDWKIRTNGLENRLGLNPAGGRCVNLDPGYLAPGKLVLASTKNHEHRIYLRDGIYAEITLKIRHNRFTTWDWTYPDYAAARIFFDQAYQAYLQQLKA